MESEEIERDILSLIQQLMVEEGVNKYEVQFEGKCDAGDNYTAEVLFLSVVQKDGKKPYYLVAKTAKRAKELTKWMPIHMVYDREVLVYSKLFPTLRQLIKDSGCDLSFDFVPKVHSICTIQGKQTIVFENLKSRGFRLHDRKKPWDLEHSLLAMKRYGEFHALSMVLRERNPEEYEVLIQQMPNISKKFNSSMDVKSFVRPNLSNAMELLSQNGRDDLVKKYDGFIEEIEDIMNHDIEEECEKIVLGHLDCWNNNFMFQYQGEDESTPSSICLLDFQLCFPCSPVKDLSYNIYSTCDKHSLKNFDELSKTYHDSLSRTLLKFFIKSDDVFSYEQLRQHWKKFGKFGLVHALLVLKICLLDEEEVPDFTAISKNAENVQDFTEALNIPVKNTEEYNRRVLDIFVHFGHNFL